MYIKSPKNPTLKKKQEKRKRKTKQKKKDKREGKSSASEKNSFYHYFILVAFFIFIFLFFCCHLISQSLDLTPQPHLPAKVSPFLASPLDFPPSLYSPTHLLYKENPNI